MSRIFPVATGSAAMICVGGSVAVSGLLADAPLFTTQSARYAVACLLLIAFARLSRAPLVRPRGGEWLWLTGIAATGMIVFNLALVQGAKHAEPAVLGVAVACVPLVLAAAGPANRGRGPRRPVLAGALLVTVGATLVQGLGRTDGIGLAWAFVTFGCEAAFTLLAVPVLGRHGPVGVSVHTTWLAAAMLAALGLAHEGPAAITRLSRTDLLAGGYLAVAVTAVAFVLWYACVSRLGAGRAGLLTGLAPIAAALAGVALGGPAPRPPVWAGIAVVAAGLVVGLRPAAAAGRAGSFRRAASGSVRTTASCTSPSHATSNYPRTESPHRHPQPSARTTASPPESG
ncbi:DMT family transporter [Actinoplanes sp. NPDC026623]|uniref:DMT family transporter n=1 Tax=Actinoplanes sp. NPDC026623 TaxID=3155610 RepID=UPI0033D943F8